MRERSAHAVRVARLGLGTERERAIRLLPKEEEARVARVRERLFENNVRDETWSTAGVSWVKLESWVERTCGLVIADIPIILRR